MITPPLQKKYCLVACAEGAPCSCRTYFKNLLYNEMMKTLDEDDEKIYGNPNTFSAHDILNPINEKPE